MRTLYLLRHARPKEAGRFIGHSDPALSEEGRRQARRLVEAARDWNLDAVAGSDLLRARQSVQPLLDAFGLGYWGDPGLRERHFGHWEGLSWKEIERLHPDEAQSFLNDWLRLTPAGGEAVQAMADRVEGAWQHLLKRSWKRLLLVGHAGTNRVLLCRLLGMPLQNMFRLAQGYSAVSQLELNATEPVLRLFNQETITPG